GWCGRAARHQAHHAGSAHEKAEDWTSQLGFPGRMRFGGNGFSALKFKADAHALGRREGQVSFNLLTQARNQRQAHAPAGGQIESRRQSDAIVSQGQLVALAGQLRQADADGA
nr:hypothetical protein [Tanacetum cinerariifolium]